MMPCAKPFSMPWYTGTTPALGAFKSVFITTVLSSATLAACRKLLRSAICSTSIILFRETRLSRKRSTIHSSSRNGEPAQYGCEMPAARRVRRTPSLKRVQTNLLSRFVKAAIRPLVRLPLTSRKTALSHSLSRKRQA